MEILTNLYVAENQNLTKPIFLSIIIQFKTIGFEAQNSLFWTTKQAILFFLKSALFYIL